MQIGVNILYFSGIFQAAMEKNKCAQQQEWRGAYLNR